MSKNRNENILMVAIADLLKKCGNVRNMDIFNYNRNSIEGLEKSVDKLSVKFGIIFKGDTTLLHKFSRLKFLVELEVNENINTHDKLIEFMSEEFSTTEQWEKDRIKNVQMTFSYFHQIQKIQENNVESKCTSN
jgi:hypothetical protein